MDKRLWRESQNRFLIAKFCYSPMIATIVGITTISIYGMSEQNHRIESDMRCTLHENTDLATMRGEGVSSM